MITMERKQSIDRLPPNSMEAEQGMLGSILTSPKDCLSDCISKIKAGHEVFYDLRHQTIYEVMVGMYESSKHVDIITVQQTLKDRGMLDQIGGISYLSHLQDLVPSAANLSYYRSIVLEKFLLRKMISTCTESVSKIYDYEGDVDALISEYESKALGIADLKETNTNRSCLDFVKEATDRIEFYFNNQGKISGIKTGFFNLDKLTDGLHGGEMVVLAARPSCGKTTFAMNIVEDVAVKQGIPTGVFSLEMMGRDLMVRSQCSLSGQSLQDIRDGRIKDPKSMVMASAKLARAPIFIDDESSLTINQVRARARRMVSRNKVKLIVIDYLQLMRSNSKRAQMSRQIEISEISSGVKAMAKELNVPVIVLSQLNRDMEKDKKRKPRLSDLRESGSIEQDADMVAFLYNPNAGDEDDDKIAQQTVVPVNLLIAKQRNGPAGVEVNLVFMKNLTRFEQVSKFDDVVQ